MPEGLSSSRTPSTRRRGARGLAPPPATSALAVLLAVLGDSLVDKLRQPHAGLDRVVVQEVELRDRVELHAVRELAAKEARRARQSLHRVVRVLAPREVR